jgi:hypothetical protein
MKKFLFVALSLAVVVAAAMGGCGRRAMSGSSQSDLLQLARRAV